MSGAAFLRLKKLTGSGIVLVAARHNRRAIQAEVGANGSIDPLRTHLNETLHGPAAAADVAKLAKDRMAQAGVGKPRKDAVMAVEVLFSLPVDSDIDQRAFFDRCWRWSAEQFGGLDNILSVDVHRDEAAPHCHVLVLPLNGSRMIGSDMVGNVTRLLALQSRFHKEVGEPFGLPPQPRRLSRQSKTAGAQAILKHLRMTNDAVFRSSVFPAIREAIEANPTPFLVALNIGTESAPAPRKKKTMAQIFTSKGRGPDREPNPIGFVVPSLSQTL
ncbi:MAG: plasmid recombination protein [Burkholderiaceae bacterium]|nr:plasmid recombination protein [Burkholderiaceae bacterium]